MATNFPTSLDNFTNPTSTDAMNSVTVPHATQHANLNDAVEALEAKVGVNSSAVASSLDYRVGVLEANELPETIINAKGDLIVGSADDTAVRLAVGTNGHALVADSVQTTGIKWAAVGDVTLTGTETLTNKTLTSPVLNQPILSRAEERWNVAAVAATGTVNFDAVTASAWLYTTNASGNWTLNVRGDSSTTLSSLLAVGDSITIAFAVTMTTAYYQTGFQIDGSSVTPEWQGGTAPSAGNANSYDVYIFTIIKTAATPTYVVLGSRTQFT